jgi:hypothetical protein
VDVNWVFLCFFSNVLINVANSKRIRVGIVVSNKEKTSGGVMKAEISNRAI